MDNTYKLLAVSFFGTHKIVLSDVTEPVAEQKKEELEETEGHPLLDYKVIDDKSYNMFYKNRKI